tara:strand:+ start:31888 stop:32499 length:612 start_codon:yes stop_codon:yes gene_type:complete
MPTPDDAPSVALTEKILAQALPLAAIEGWTPLVYRKACDQAGVSLSEAALALPNGSDSLVPALLDLQISKISTTLKALPLGEMKIRERVTKGVEIWLDLLSEHPEALRKALDWLAVRPLASRSLPALIWSVADAIWTGIGDDATGFTYASKRTTLSAVITSTLAVWRKNADDKTVWMAFLDRRIEDVMAFEKFKASVKFPRFA